MEKLLRRKDVIPETVYKANCAAGSCADEWIHRPPNFAQQQFTNAHVRSG
jgi:hypothetical protein